MDNPLDAPPLTIRMRSQEDGAAVKESESTPLKVFGSLTITPALFTPSETSPRALTGRVSTQSPSPQKLSPLILEPDADIHAVSAYLNMWVNEAPEENIDREKAKNAILLFLENPAKNRLDLEGNFSELPNVFHLNSFKNISRLEITNCVKITELPTSFTALRNLAHLVINGCTNLSKLPESFGELTGLKSLSLINNGIEELPQSIGSLAQLKALNLSGCVSLKGLPESIGALDGVFSLILTDCRSLVELPKSIGLLKSLNNLSLIGCTSLHSIPEEICNLQRSSGTKITDPYGQSLPVGRTLQLLPQSAGVDDVKRYLDRWIDESPAERSDREGVKKAIVDFLNSTESTLVLKGNFSSLPPIFYLDGLVKRVTHLVVAGCTQLTEIPCSIYMLGGLSVLNLSGCTRLTKLPEEIDRLTHLEVLDLSGCLQLLKLPHTLINLNQLKVFDIHGCVLLIGSEQIGKRRAGGSPKTKGLRILSRTSSCVLYEVMPGKSARQATCLCKEPQEARIIQPRQKGGTCWYYTFNYLRQRVGKGAEGCEMHQSMREVEKAVSKVRKDITKYENDLRWYGEIDHNQKLKSFLMTIDREFAINLINENEINKNNLFQKKFAESYGLENLSNLKGGARFLIIARHQLYEELKKFSKTPLDEINNFHGFLVQKRDLGKSDIKDNYLKHVLPDYLVAIDAHKKQLGSVGFFKQYNQEQVFLNTIARGYQLQHSSWSPDQGVISLITEITETGPIAVGGVIGTPYYKERPLPTGEEFGGRHTYFWNADARTLSASSSGHMILLVGAKKEADGEFVYFIDPNDASDPSNSESQRIYRMPYLELVEHIIPIALPYLDKEGEKPTFFTPYAYCRA